MKNLVGCRNSTMKYLLILLGFSVFAQDYPAILNIDTYPWGNVETPNYTPEINEEYTDPNTGALIQRIAPNGASRFSVQYSKIPVYNANDTWMKFVSSFSGNGFVEVANPSNIIHIGVENGGYWSNTNPDLLYVFFRNSNDVSLKAQYFPNPYGSEDLLHDFTETHTDIGLGNNEGTISWDDKYMAITATKRAPYSGSPYEAIIMDLEDTRDNPNQPSNIHSRMDIDNDNIIDWVSISPTGDYFVIAYFDNLELNSWNGNAIVAYDNTRDTPSNYRVVNYTEAHAALGLDIYGEDVYLGYKDGASGCPADCMTEDDDTFLIMSRIRDGETVYKFKDTGADGLARGLYGGYISCTNTNRPGYAYVIENCCSRDNAISKDIISIRLDYDDTNDMQYFLRTNANRIPSREEGLYASISRDGTMFAFNSWWYDSDLESQFPNIAPAWFAKYPQKSLSITELDTELDTKLDVKYFNMLGQRIDVENTLYLSSGIYFIQYSSNGRTFCEKKLINN